MKRFGRLFVSYTEAERRSTLAGVNLFFGALLGAHLGTMDQLPLRDYILLVVLLAGAVTGILLVVSSRRMSVIWATVVIYVVVFGAILLVPAAQPPNMEDELQRIVAMLAVWLVLLMGIRLQPAVPEEGEPAGDKPLALEDEA